MTEQADQQPEKSERALTARKDKKLPAMQFYPGDWRKDMGVQALTFHDRGVWFEMLMLMHGSERRGVLVLNGQPMTEEMIARSIGLDIQAFHQSLAALVDTGVASREEGTGAVMCRRMVNDEYLRKVRAASGSQGGNPALLKQNRTKPDKQDPTPSSPVSVSSAASATKTKTLARSVPPEELAVTLPLVDGTEYDVTKARVAEWSLAYPGIDVFTELRRLKCWLDANPTKKKTRNGIARAIVHWLSRAQNQSGYTGVSNGNKSQHRTDANIGAARRVAERLNSEVPLEGSGSSSSIGE